MPSLWIEHVKKYQAEHGCTYKEAMQGAKCTYQCQKQEIEGGKIDMKKVSRKAKNTFKTVNRKGANTYQRVKKISDKVGNVLEKASPLLEMIDPELGVSAAAINTGIHQMTGSGVKGKGRKLGSKVNPYLSKGGSFRVASEGGSFRVASEFHGGCLSCGKGKGKMRAGHTESSMITPLHPASNPIKKKSYRSSIMEN